MSTLSTLEAVRRYKRILDEDDESAALDEYAALKKHPIREVLDYAVGRLGGLSDNLTAVVLQTVVDSQVDYSAGARRRILREARRGLDSADDDLQETALQVIARWGTSADVSRVSSLTDHPEVLVRVSSIETLLQIAPRKGRWVLQARMRAEKNPWARAALLGAAFAHRLETRLPSALFDDEWDWEYTCLFLSTAMRNLPNGPSTNVLSELRVACRTLLKRNPQGIARKTISEIAGNLDARLEDRNY